MPETGERVLSAFMFNTLLSYPSLFLSAKLEYGKFAFKFSWLQLQKRQKRCIVLKLQKKTPKAWVAKLSATTTSLMDTIIKIYVKTFIF